MELKLGLIQPWLARMMEKKIKARLLDRQVLLVQQRRYLEVNKASLFVKFSNFTSAVELKVSKLVKPHKLAKCITSLVGYVYKFWQDSQTKTSLAIAGWRIFVDWVERYGVICGKLVVAVPLDYTNQDGWKSGSQVKNNLSSRIICPMCYFISDRDCKAAIKILIKPLQSVGIGLNVSPVSSKYFTPLNS